MWFNDWVKIRIVLINKVIFSEIIMNVVKNNAFFNFPFPHKRETGLKLDGSEVSPFFDKGITCECFQMSANLPSLKGLLNNGTETSLATGFYILLLIPSGPLA